MRISREGCFLLLFATAPFAGCGGTVRGTGQGDGPPEDAAGGDGAGGPDGAGGAAKPGSGGRAGRPNAAGGRGLAAGGSPPSAGGQPPSAGGAPTPQCLWGETLICRCSENVYGAMICQADGVYGSCVCEVPLSCDDGIVNALETDVDCGGGECRACEYGRACGTDLDCLGLFCAPHGVCDAPGCADGLHNGTETDVDCGGPMCLQCSTGRCNSDFDCVSGACIDLRCVPAR